MKDRRTYEPIKASREIYTASIDEVSIKNYLDPAKSPEEYSKICKTSEDRASSSENNPFI